MQSRNGTRVFGSYEIVRSVTAREIRYCSFDQVSVAPSTPPRGEGVCCE